MILRSARWATRPLHPSAGSGKAGTLPLDKFDLDGALGELTATKNEHAA